MGDPEQSIHPLWGTFRDPAVERAFQDEAWGAEARVGRLVVLVFACLVAVSFWLDFSLPTRAGTYTILGFRLAGFGMAALVWRAAKLGRRRWVFDGGMLLYILVVAAQFTTARMLRAGHDNFPGGAVTAYVVIATGALTGLPFAPLWLTVCAALVIAVAVFGMTIMGTPPESMFIGVEVLLAVCAGSLLRARGHHLERRRAWSLTREVAQAHAEVEELLAEKAEALVQIRGQAETDPLTGLLNRRGLEALASTLLAGQRACSAFVVDLDHFKAVNDSLGHKGGDAALRHVAKLLSSACRGDDIVARWGGDELVVVLPDPDGAVGREVAARFSAALSQTPLVFAHAQHKLTASVGVAHGPGPLEALLEVADRAAYAAKRAGRDRVMHDADLEPEPPHWPAATSGRMAPPPLALAAERA